NVPEQGLDGRKTNPVPSMRVPQPEQEAELAALDAQKREIEKQVQAKLAEYEKIDVPNTPAELAAVPREYVWVDDAIPPGSKSSGKGPEDWGFAGSPQPVLSGELASQRRADGLSQHFFTDAAQPLLIGEGDMLFAH